jgi:hypothetical protein
MQVQINDQVYSKRFGNVTVTRIEGENIYFNVLYKMENLKHRLWDERGYDYPYMNTLTNKELKSLYDTEFYYD